MKKCELLQNAVIACEKGSIVMVSDKQYELARRVLKPIEKADKKEVVETEEVEAPKKETRKKKK